MAGKYSHESDPSHRPCGLDPIRLYVEPDLGGFGPTERLNPHRRSERQCDAALSGTVTSIGLTAPAEITVSDSAVTSKGRIG
jgi:hypothetical protein